MKKLAIALVCILLVVGVVGGTLAWLTDTADPVVNTFTTSGIDITLEETTKTYQMIPGWTIEKDPIVTVKEGSEDCWVFIKVQESDNLDNYIEYTIDSNNWTPLVDENNDGIADDGVYYCYAKDITADRGIKVLLNNEVTVKDTVTKEMMEDLKETNAVQPTLTFTAYATQYYETNGQAFEPAEAWAVLNP